MHRFNREAIFNPALAGHKSTLGAHEDIYKSIFDCDLDVRKDLLRNIIVAGGNTMFRGFQQEAFNKGLPTLTKADEGFDPTCRGCRVDSTGTVRLSLYE